MKKVQESTTERNSLERGLQMLILAMLTLGGYKIAEGNDERQAMALLTISLAIASADKILAHFRKKN